MSSYETLGYRGSHGRSPMRAVHDLSTMYPDSDSGIGSSFRTKSRMFASDDFIMPAPRLHRSRSMSRINCSLSRDTSPESGVSLNVPLDYSLRTLNDTLEDSESRRSVLMHKLKEAQETLSLQNDRLAKIETSAKDNAVLVEDLKFKEREYRKKIQILEKAEEEKEMLRMENVRLRQEMQDRITALDFQLKSLQSQHQSKEMENNRNNLLDQTTSCLSLLEEENTKLQKERDNLQNELGSLKEVLHMAKANLDAVVGEKNNLKNSMDTVAEENRLLSKKVHEMAGQMVEMRTLLQAVKEENERLSSNWKNLSQDKHRASKQIENYQDTVADLKARLSTVSADKDRLFQEKLDLNHKLQQLVLDKEQLIKIKMSLEEQLVELQGEVNRSRMSSSKKQEDAKRLEEELQAVKKVSQELSVELSSVKAYYERALEQISVLENGKKMQQQHQELAEQEKRRLQGEVDRLTQLLDGRSREVRKDREELEESVTKMKLMHSAQVLDGLSRFEADLKQLRNEKSHTDNRNQELEMKLQQANEELRKTVSRQQEEMMTWKTSCERLTTAVTRKEAELQSLTDKCNDTESIVTKLKGELKVIIEQYEALAEQKDDTDRLIIENRRLLQEKVENEQMIKLLETQKTVLTKSTESSLNKLHDVEQLTGKVEQLRSENELLRDRILELEKVRDNLIKQKEDVLANSELIYKQPSMDELEKKIDELRVGNKQLREINDVMSEKLEAVEHENSRLKHAMGEAPSQTSDVEKEGLLKESEKLRADYSVLKNQYDSLESRHQKMIINYGHETSIEKDGEDMTKLRKERDALKKQVQLLSGQLVLVEGSKKRLEETVSQLQQDIANLRIKCSDSKQGPEVKRLETEVKALKDKLLKFEGERQQHVKTVKGLKDELEEERTKKPSQIRESLEDVGEELHHMREELHKLMEEIKRKDTEILALEAELRKMRDEVERKERGMSDMKKLIEDLELQNSNLRQAVHNKQDELETAGNDVGPIEFDVPEFPPPAVASSAQNNTSPKSLKDELQEALKKKEAGGAIVRVSDPQMSKKFLEAKPLPPSDKGKLFPTASAGKYGTQFFFKPEASAADGSGRLQSLISKYRSHSDMEEQDKRPKPFSMTTGRLGLRSKPISLTAPKVPESRLSSTEKSGIPKPGLKGPPPPTLPKPKVKQDGARNGVEAGASSASRQDGQDSLQDTQEQKDINALIQKRGVFYPKPFKSVSPPKITSKVIADLLKQRGQRCSKSRDKLKLSSR